MAQFNMHEAKTRLSELVQMAESGEEVIIARNGKPVARLVEVEPPAKPVEEPKLRGAWGALKGKIWMSDDFDEPDEELIDLFYNSKIFPDDVEPGGDAK
jgi:prevent-host-death family protein